jgi:hypothetical protein
MEHEGGLDRKAATLRAFELCFPGDYQAMKETAANYADGEAVLCEFLEELIKTGPKTLIEGATMNAETKKAETHGIAPDRPPQSQETRHKGVERMAEYAGWRSA